MTTAGTQLSSGEAPAPRTQPPALSVRALVPVRGLDATIEVRSAAVVAVLGRNGAGKSTLLDVIAGLLDPGAGSVRIGVRTVLDERTWVPAHARGVALLAQRPLLFPHLSVLDNVAFGPRSAGHRRRRARELAREALAEVGIPELASRRSAEISGGQAQRVALARALAVDPHVMLLDEPLAALDVDSAAQMRALLQRVLRNGARTALLVTHSLHDIRTLADDVVVIENGRAVEAGPVPRVLANPQSAFLTSLLAGPQHLERPDEVEQAGEIDQAEPVHS